VVEAPFNQLSDRPANSLRVSSYAIGAPLDGQPSWILLHGFTGAMDKVDLRIGDFLVKRRGRRVTDDALAQAGITSEERERLVAQGYLTTLLENEERRVVLSLAAAMRQRDLSLHRASFVIVPTYVCNLRCPYCFQGHDMHAGKGVFGRVMTTSDVAAIFSVIDDLRRPGAVARLLGVAEEGDHLVGPDASSVANGRQQVTLFGGEPLLPETRAVVGEIVSEAASRDLEVSAITNGVQLRYFQDLLGPDGISSLQITLDGVAHRHDQRRIGPGLRHTFAMVVENIDMALTRGAGVDVRMNVNIDNQEDCALLEAFFF